jgi:hypothetical protein
MKTFSPTIRFLLVPLLLVSLVASGLAMPVASAMAARLGQPVGDCCRTEAAAVCCGTACCQSPVPRPERSPSDVPKRSDDRSNDGKLGWAAIALVNTPAINTLERHGDSLAVPHSGSPSLIAQHIRLQI